MAKPDPDPDTPHNPPGPTDWQREQDTTETAPQDQPTSIFETAKRFLQQDHVKDAPVSAKKSFLETKDIPPHVIDQLLYQDDNDSNINHFAQHPPSPPPVITYPEFLLRPQNPPLVTPARLLTTAYVTATLAATVYGVSRFLVRPMSNQLTCARHELATHTSDRIHTLNERLTSFAAEPTDRGQEFFPPDEATVDAQAAIAHRLRCRLDELLADDRNGQSAISQLRNSALELTTYLESLTFQQPTSIRHDHKHDAISELKTEIRQVKGVLLNARFGAGVLAMPSPANVAAPVQT